MNDRLHHIVKIEAVGCGDLMDAAILPGHGVRLPAIVGRNPIELVGMAAFSFSSKKEKGTTTYTSKVSADIAENFTPSAARYAYLLTEVSGDVYLLGSSEPPYPLTSISWDAGDKPSDKACGKLEISYTERYPPLKVL